MVLLSLKVTEERRTRWEIRQSLVLSRNPVILDG